jgi:hypothetical protein
VRRSDHIASKKANEVAHVIFKFTLFFDVRVLNCLRSDIDACFGNANLLEELSHVLRDPTADLQCSEAAGQHSDL